MPFEILGSRISRTSMAPTRPTPTLSPHRPIARALTSLVESVGLNLPYFDITEGRTAETASSYLPILSGCLQNGNLPTSLVDCPGCHPMTISFTSCRFTPQDASGVS